LRSRNIPHQANPHGMVTVSIGCATVVPSLGKHALSLIELADKALYEAKRRGRNRVCSANVRNRNGDESITCEELQPSVARAD